MTVPHPPSSPPPPPGAERSRPAVLVVDEDPDIQQWVATVLEPVGCRVAAACDALTGLMVVRSFNPDVIVVDLHLPGGGGKAFLERLRTLTAFRHTPVLIWSAEVSAKTAGSLQPLGVVGMLEKPVNARLFVQAILSAHPRA